MRRLVVDCSTGEQAVEVVSPEEAAGIEALWGEVTPPARLDPPGVIAALLAATEVVGVQDAANTVGLTPADLIHEVEAWAYAAAIAGL